MQSQRSYRWFDLILGLFVAVLLISNIASTKIVEIPFFRLFGRMLKLSFDGGTLLFPVSYIFGDILTEVYGFARSRRVIWTGFFSLVLMSLTFWVVGVLPAAPDWNLQGAYRDILMATPRIALASIIAYFSGEFLNSTVLSRMKVWTGGRWLWTRTIGSTLVGEFADTVLFVTVAFAGVLPGNLLWAVGVSNYIFKTGFEIIATPVTYRVVRWLKWSEHEDKFDYDADYNPFRLS